ncbi:family 16 glycosylhydrolase [Paenibacillus rhizovicinus]|uniref:Family 16 glycosylhydrolase n=1 Tax=Paenibacillus rhizovicinus TaxID=2704463 RepID=A0A6C0NU45_9BACL|nr:family 16 glycosylhydrolase [Paenibacillus rhizovicinus]QHW29687.1 family 16 glycosylhydrolase [Paenibacillus rhizovicinus]
MKRIYAILLTVALVLSMSAVPAFAAQVAETLTVTLSTDNGNMNDGQVVVTAVSGETGELYYTISEGQPATPPNDTTDTVESLGAQPLTLNAPIGSKQMQGDYLNVYDVSGDGHIAGYAEVPLMWANIGKLLYKQTESSTSIDFNAAGAAWSSKKTPMLGDSSWTDYAWDLDFTPTTWTNGNIQFQVRNADGHYYYLLLGQPDAKFAGLQLGPAGTWVNGGSVGATPLNVSTHVQVKADGPVISLTVGGTTFKMDTSTAGATVPVYLKGGVTLALCDGGGGNSVMAAAISNSVVHVVRDETVTRQPDTHTVSFNTPLDATAVAAVSGVLNGGLLAQPADPTRSGYTFGGWYTDSALSTPWNFASDTVTADITLYSKWNPELAEGINALTATLVSDPAIISTLPNGTLEATAVAGGSAGGTYYYVISSTQQAAPGADTNIGAINRAVPFTAGTPFGTNVSPNKWLLVYQTDSDGIITGYGTTIIPYHVIGTLVSSVSSATVLPGKDASNPTHFGDSSLTDYEWNFDLTPVTGEHGGIQFWVRDNGALHYYILLGMDTSWMAMSDNQTWQNVGPGGSGITPKIGQKVHYRIVADGNTISLYNRLPGAAESLVFTNTLSSNGGHPVLLGGNAAVYSDPNYTLDNWATLNTDGNYKLNVANSTVNAIHHPSDTGNKNVMPAANFLHIPVPVAGKYPIGRYKYPDSSHTSSTTIEWSPEITSTFDKNTVYTAKVTLAPMIASSTYDGINPANITGVPAINGTTVTGATTAVDGDNLVETITFAPTGSTIAPFGEDALVFNDDFNGTSVDTSKWTVSPTQPRQGRSVWLPNEVSVDGSGNLAIHIEKDPNGGTAYYSGLSASDQANFIDTGAVTQKDDSINDYGYYESRIKFPVVSGTWGAFWKYASVVLNVGDQGVDGTENDIVESIRNDIGDIDSAIHWDGYGSDHKSMGITTNYPSVYDGNFHTFAMDWSPYEYIYYVDDVEVARIDRNTKDGSGNTPGICQNPTNIILSVEGASWAGVLPQGFDGAQMLVDYVKVYNQPKHIQIPPDQRFNLTDYVKLDLSTEYDKSASKWQVAATLTNVAASGNPQSGELTFLGNTQPYTVNAGTPVKFYYDVTPSTTEVSTKYTASYTDTTVQGTGIGTASTTLGVVNATTNNPPVTVDGLLNDAAWANAKPIDLNKGTASGMDPAVTATGKLAWDNQNLYLGVTVDTPSFNQTNSGGNIWMGDGMQVALRGPAGYRELGFALNSGDASITQWNWGADGSLTGANSAIPASSATTAIVRDAAAGTTTYEIAINWAYLGVDGDTVAAGDAYNIALVVNDSAAGARGYLAYFDGIASGAKGVGMGQLLLEGSQQQLSNDATLKSLTVDAAALTPVFDPASTAYSADVANAADSILIAAAPNDANAAVTGDGAHALAVGANVITVTVTAQDGTVKSYTVTVNRAPAAPADIVNISGVPVHFTVQSGTTILDLSDKSVVQDILINSGNTIVIDLSGGNTASAKVTIDVSLFKKIGKTVTIVTKDGSYSVTTQQLWNNSGKPRVITIKNGKLEFKNG